MGFMVDIETLGTESTSVVLSCAIVHFDKANFVHYNELLDKTLFVKFNAKDQIKNYKRTVDQSTLEWWSKQHKHIRSISFDPSDKDVNTIDGINLIKQYIQRVPNWNQQTFWQRGTLDQVCLDSLTRSLAMESLTSYNNWRDMRTAIDLLYGSSNGYTEVDHVTFDKTLVEKHTPYHDVCYDVMQLLFGKEQDV